MAAARRGTGTESRRPRPRRSGTSDPRRSVAETRETIMKVATQEFLHRGYSKTTMADLAAKSGTSVGLLYYHFGSKEDLILAIWSEYQVDQQVRVRRALKDARTLGTDDPIELLLVSVRAYLEGAWHHRDEYWLVHARDLPPRLVDARRRSGQRWKQRNAQALASKRPLLSRVMMATVVGFLTEVSLEIVQSDDDEAAAVIDEAMFVLGSLLTSFAEVQSSRSR